MQPFKYLTFFFIFAAFSFLHASSPLDPPPGDGKREAALPSVQLALEQSLSLVPFESGESKGVSALPKAAEKEAKKSNWVTYAQPCPQQWLKFIVVAYPWLGAKEAFKCTRLSEYVRNLTLGNFPAESSPDPQITGVWPIIARNEGIIWRLVPPDLPPQSYAAIEYYDEDNTPEAESKAIAPAPASESKTKAEDEGKKKEPPLILVPADAPCREHVFATSFQRCLALQLKDTFELEIDEFSAAYARMRRFGFSEEFVFNIASAQFRPGALGDPKKRNAYELYEPRIIAAAKRGNIRAKELCLFIYLTGTPWPNVTNALLRSNVIKDSILLAMNNENGWGPLKLLYTCEAPDGLDIEHETSSIFDRRITQIQFLVRKRFEDHNDAEFFSAFIRKSLGQFHFRHYYRELFKSTRALVEAAGSKAPLTARIAVLRSYFEDSSMPADAQQQRILTTFNTIEELLAAQPSYGTLRDLESLKRLYDKVIYKRWARPHGVTMRPNLLYHSKTILELKRERGDRIGRECYRQLFNDISKAAVWATSKEGSVLKDEYYADAITYIRHAVDLEGKGDPGPLENLHYEAFEAYVRVIPHLHEPAAQNTAMHDFLKFVDRSIDQLRGVGEIGQGGVNAINGHVSELRGALQATNLEAVTHLDERLAQLQVLKQQLEAAAERKLEEEQGFLEFEEPQDEGAAE